MQGTLSRRESYGGLMLTFENGEKKEYKFPEFHGIHFEDIELSLTEPCRVAFPLGRQKGILEAIEVLFPKEYWGDAFHLPDFPHQLFQELRILSNYQVVDSQNAPFHIIQNMIEGHLSKDSFYISLPPLPLELAPDLMLELVLNESKLWQPALDEIHEQRLKKLEKFFHRDLAKAIQLYDQVIPCRNKLPIRLIYRYPSDDLMQKIAEKDILRIQQAHFTKKDLTLIESRATTKTFLMSRGLNRLPQLVLSIHFKDHPLPICVGSPDDNPLRCFRLYSIEHDSNGVPYREALLYQKSGHWLQMRRVENSNYYAQYRFPLWKEVRPIQLLSIYYHLVFDLCAPLEVDCFVATLNIKEYYWDEDDLVAFG